MIGLRISIGARCSVHQNLLLFHSGGKPYAPSPFSYLSTKTPIVKVGRYERHVNEFVSSMPLSQTSTCRTFNFANGAGVWMSALRGNICPRRSERGNLPTYNATKSRIGCTDYRKKVWPRLPATAFWRCLRQSALWLGCVVFCPQDNHRAWASCPSKFIHNGSAISRKTRRNADASTGKSDVRKLLPSDCFC